MAHSKSSVGTYPFDDPDANIIIRSSDGRDFRLHKEVLALVSPVFKQMFALPRENTPQQAIDETVDGIPVVGMSEESQTMENLLGMFYPVPRDLPTFTKLEEVQAVLEAGRKYEMDVVSLRMEGTLMSFAEENPLGVFATARTCMSDEVARKAARLTLQCTLRPTSFTMPTELRLLSLPAYWALAWYHDQCTQVAKTCTTSYSWVSKYRISEFALGLSVCGSSWAWFECPRPNCRTGASPSRWWMDYMQGVGSELAIRPMGSVAQAPVVLEPALAKAATCSACGPRAFRELTVFSKLLADRIDDATSKVPLELNP